MGLLLRLAGWGGTAAGLVFVLLGGVAALSAGDDETLDATAGFVAIGIFFGVPGGLALWRSFVLEARARARRELVGYLRTHDAFTVPEMAKKLGRPEIETEGLVNAVIGAEALPFAFHRPTREYINPHRVKRAHQLVARCPSCGAAVGAQIVFDGEQVCCEYCDAPLV